MVNIVDLNQEYIFFLMLANFLVPKTVEEQVTSLVAYTFIDGKFIGQEDKLAGKFLVEVHYISDSDHYFKVQRLTFQSFLEKAGKRKGLFYKKIAILVQCSLKQTQSDPRH